MYHRYGGRGIAVCIEWESFALFLEQMGERPVGCSLDRVDNNKNYSADNCRWATRKEQANNRSTNVWITLEGRTQTISEWAAERQLSLMTIYGRLRKGWTQEEALVKKDYRFREK